MNANLRAAVCAAVLFLLTYRVAYGLLTDTRNALLALAITTAIFVPILWVRHRRGGRS